MANERIDVLAVMDEMIDCYGSVEECQDDTEFLVAAREARAAVAELIEAAGKAQAMLQTVHECASHECDDCREHAGINARRLRDAIARAGGAS